MANSHHKPGGTMRQTHLDRSDLPTELMHHLGGRLVHIEDELHKVLSGYYFFNASIVALIDSGRVMHNDKLLMGMLQADEYLEHSGNVLHKEVSALKDWLKAMQG